MYNLFVWAQAHPIETTALLLWVCATYYIVAWGGIKARRK